MRKRHLKRKPSTQLAALEAQVNRLFETMQTSRSKRGVKAALTAGPEELGRAAVAAARKTSEAMVLWEARLDMLGPFASSLSLEEALRTAPALSPAVDYLRGYLAGRAMGFADGYDPDLAVQIEIADGVMKENRSVLRKLAK